MKKDKNPITKDQLSQFKEMLEILSRMDLSDPDQAIFILFKSKDKKENKSGAFVAGNKNMVLATILAATENDEGLKDLLMETALITGIRFVKDIEKHQVLEKQGKVAHD